MTKSEKSLSFKSLTAVFVFFHRLIGVLPLENRDFNFLSSQMLLIYFMFIGLLISVMFLRYCITRLIQGAVELDSVFVTVMATSTIVRYYILVYHRFEFRDAIDACRDIWEDCTPSEHQIVRWFERKSWILFKLLAGSGLLINIFCSIGSIVVRLPPDEPNGTERRMLPYKWFIEDREYYWMGYELIFGLQVLILHHLTVLTATVDTAGPLLMLLSCGFLKALQERFFAAAVSNEKFFIEDKLSYQPLLTSCSKFHQNVLNIIFMTACAGKSRFEACRERSGAISVHSQPSALSLPVIHHSVGRRLSSGTERRRGDGCVFHDSDVSGSSDWWTLADRDHKSPKTGTDYGWWCDQPIRREIRQPDNQCHFIFHGA
ncbi:odorant receptor 233 isoform X2 [Nasonia vitripennis]|uniref:Odorant receptor n=1 Tax=Nasonia vitripennis TaxID=7425 RepID=A0A7M7T6E2_NASVI|nr:odorant receptor 233 isoform X2 [Nasonia vitripennis]